MHVNNNSLSVVDQQVVDLWNKQSVKEDGHYTLPIPFKEHPPRLPNNYTMAKHRLNLLGKRLKKDLTLRQKYTEGIRDSLLKGYAEEVVDINREDGCVWYLPHHPVLHPRKPEKVRIVFDCAARYQGTSLNDHVHQGPDLTSKLLGVLLKFRQEPVALNADIESMFYQVRVPSDERDVLRFLWWEDNDPDKPPKHYRMMAHLFGGVWSPSAANFALQRVAEDNHGNFSDDTVETLKRNFYVDEWHRWLNDLPLLSALTIPRCLRSTSTSCLLPTQLHHFSDASELAYGAVSYIRIGDTCRLVMSKARLAPIKPVSIPRLELLAAVVATELDQHIKRHLEIPIERTFFWTDSTIVLQYINNKHCRFKTFVANRTSKIHKRSEPSQWKHIDSASNPADDVSRGMSMGEILSSEQWVSGPHFLQLEEEHWPAQPIINDLPEDAEIKRAKEVYAASIKPNQVMKNAVDRLLERYSS